jgi:hypothetical protein
MGNKRVSDAPRGAADHSRQVQNDPERALKRLGRLGRSFRTLLGMPHDSRRR